MHAVHDLQPGVRRLRRRVAGALCAAALLLAVAPPAQAASVGEVGQVTFDLVILRPLNAMAVVVGMGFFAISAPLVLPSGDVSTPFEVFVYAPYEYAFERPLGDF